MGEESVRIDKWLWAVRIFKTRSLAAEACKKSRVLVNGEAVKPSKTIVVGSLVDVKKPPVIYSYEVIGITERRMGAKFVPDFLKDLTPEEELVKLNLMKFNLDGFRQKGSGRPTKRDRRQLDDLTE